MVKEGVVGQMEGKGDRVACQVHDWWHGDRDNARSKRYGTEDKPIECSQARESSFDGCDPDRRGMRRKYRSQIKPKSKPNEMREVPREKRNPRGPADRIRYEEEHHGTQAPQS